jgi:hypothetical protein
VEKVYYKKREDLKEEFKCLERDVSIIHQAIDNFIFQVGTSQALLSHSSQNEWVVGSRCTHHIAKDASLFISLDVAYERKIYVVDDFSLNIVGEVDVSCQHGKIFNFYHVPNLIINMLYVAHLT